MAQQTSYSSTLTSNNKRHRDDSGSEQSPAIPPKKIILGTNEKDRTIAAVNTPNNNMAKVGSTSTSSRRKSIVVSNIGNSITPEYLTNYLANELNIEKENILVTPLQSQNKNFNSLQYRVSTPEANYGTLMTPSTWPKNGRVRDYIFKRRNNTEAASMENFLEKETASRSKDLETTKQSQVIPPTVEEIIMNSTLNDSTMNTEMEQAD